METMPIECRSVPVDGVAKRKIEDVVPLPPEPAIDQAHLARMTLGDRSLETEVLALFHRQADLLLARMASAPPAAGAAFAHTLKGSASGIGAWRVAEAASVVETSAACPAETAQAVDRLVAAVREVQELIEGLRAGGASVGAREPL
jgi:hypothetical protein